MSQSPDPQASGWLVGKRGGVLCVVVCVFGILGRSRFVLLRSNSRDECTIYTLLTDFIYICESIFKIIYYE